ncbi:MAG: hypothetical protein Kow0068_07790 [Marinilabiliales bacterium]
MFVVIMAVIKKVYYQYYQNFIIFTTKNMRHSGLVIIIISLLLLNYLKAQLKDTCTNFNINVSVISNSICGAQTGSAEVNITGGNPPYTIYWSNGDSTTTADSLSAGLYSVQVTDANDCYAWSFFYIQDTDGHYVNSSNVTDVSCFGANDGAIDIDVSGVGSSLYDYYWSNGATTQDLTNLSAGNYLVMIKDFQDCITFWETTVTEPAKMETNIQTITQPDCNNNNGAIMVNVTGGTSPYSYYWSIGSTNQQINNLYSGFYSVTVNDANGCSSTLSTALSDTGSPVAITDSIISANCGSSNGSIYINVSGGSQPYASYLWSNNSTNEDLINAPAGEYSITITDAANCKSVYYDTITTELPQQQPICVVSVDTITQHNLIVWEKVQTSGISHYNIYREGIFLGQYDLIASVPYDDMSEYIDPIADSRLKSWRYRITAVDSCGNESAFSIPHKTINLKTNLYSIQKYKLVWDKYEGFQYDYFHIMRHLNSTGWVFIDSVPNTTLSYIDKPGGYLGLRYCIGVSPDSPCIPTSSAKANGGPYSQSTSNMEDEGIISSSLINVFEDFTVNVYPNPNNGIFTIELPDKYSNMSCDFLDITGNTVFITQLNELRNEFDFSDLPKGVYIAKFSFDKYTKHIKIIIQ